MQEAGGENKKALRAGAGYTIGNILLKGITFLSVPIFSRIMSQAEFGVYNAFITYDAILYVIMGLALHSSVQSANVEFKGKLDEYTSSVSLIYLIICCLLLLLVSVFAPLLVGLVDFSLPVIYMMVIYSFGSAIASLYNSRLSVEYRYKQYIVLSVINTVVSIGLSLALMYWVFPASKDIGRIVGITVASLGLAAAVLILQYRKARPAYAREYWKFGLRYSLPIVPHGICQVLLAQFDLLMIRHIVGDEAAGLYSLPQNIKLILTVITTSVASAWTTWYYSQMEKQDAAEIKKRSVQVTAAFTVAAIGLFSLSPELVFILGGEQYEPSRYVAIPMIADAFVLFLYNIIIPGEYYKKKTTFVMLGTLIAAVINIVTNAVFIPRFGYIAAAYTTLFSYVCYLILHLALCRHIVGFHALPIKWLLLFSGMVVGVGAFDLIFADSLLLRWGLCALIVIPVGIVTLKKYLRKRKEKNALPQGKGE